MTNALQEFMDFIANKPKVLCAEVSHFTYAEENIAVRNTELKLDYTDEDFNTFLKAIDFNYNYGDWLYEVVGTIWFKDGSWADRCECEGSEWWQHHNCPAIPEYLK